VIHDFIYENKGRLKTIDGGNVKVSSDLSSSPNFQNQSTYRLTGFARHLFTVNKDGESVSESIILNFGGSRETIPADYNFTWNNLHLVNNDFRYTRSSGQSMQGQTVVVDNTLDASGTGWKTNGPAVEGVFVRARSIATSNGIHFHQAFGPAVQDTQGWVGKFGNYANSIGGSGGLATKTRGITAVLNGFLFPAGNPAFFLKPAQVSLSEINIFVPIPDNPGEVSDLVLYPTLNVEMVGIKRGINIGVYYGVGSGGANVTVNPFPTQISLDARL
jgi:hypothetical protein